MARIALLLLSLLSLALASDYMFTDLAVYGLDRCISNGVGPCTDLLSVASPYRQSALDDRDLATASVRFNNRNEIVVDTKNGGVVGHIRRGELRFPDKLKRKDRKLKGENLRSFVINEAHSGDIVVVFVPHSTRLEVTKAQFYDQFNDRQANTVDLTDDFVQAVIGSDSTSRRFTLITARVERFKNALSRRFTYVAGPVAQNPSNNDDEQPLSFLGSQPSIFQPVQPQQQIAQGQAPTSLPAGQSSQGRRPTQNTGHTQVYSNAAPSSYQSQGSVSFAPRNTNPNRF